jgi:endonuclease/exonuclease/phosphatase family metal-dependent hydrolase
MRIATFNTWKNEGSYWTRINAIGDALARLELDIIALQECFYAPAITADTAADVALALGLHVSRAPMREKVRTMDGAAVLSRADLAILTREPPLDVAFARLSPDLRDGERLALRADLKLGRQQIRVVNVHLTHLRDAAASEIRSRQARETLSFARSNWKDPIIIAGDLNAALQSPSLSPFFDDPEMDKSCHAAREQPVVSGAALLEGGEIDHVLVFDPMRRVTCISRKVELAGSGLSDHPVIVAELDCR